MPEWLDKFLIAWIPLFVALDPIGLVPLFLGLTQGVEPTRRHRIGRQAALTAAIVAVGFMFLGRALFNVVGISVGDFKVAGGIILLVLAARDLVRTDTEPLPLAEDFGVVPLGLPMIAGPATLTALLILLDSVGPVYTLAALAVNLALVAIAFHFSERLASLIGLTGLRAVSKIISLLLAAIAVSLIRAGWQTP